MFYNIQEWIWIRLVEINWFNIRSVAFKKNNNNNNKTIIMLFFKGRCWIWKENMFRNCLFTWFDEVTWEDENLYLYISCKKRWSYVCIFSIWYIIYVARILLFCLLLRLYGVSINSLFPSRFDFFLIFAVLFWCCR